MAGSDLTAMGIESFFVCSLLILLGLGKSEESENRSFEPPDLLTSCQLV
jgi:hypothetical protein